MRKACFVIVTWLLVAYGHGQQPPPADPEVQAESLAIRGDTNAFIDLSKIPPNEILPGIRIRTPYGQNLMLSFVEIDAGTEFPRHSHPHEQGGILLEGRLKMTIGSQTRILEPGSLYLIPPNTPHEGVALSPVKLLDVFSPIREDYAKFLNDYVKKR